MAPIRRFLIPLLLIAGTVAISAERAAAGTEVDLALVIAVDVSPSMEIDEQELQREGFVAAFRSPKVHSAISNGAIGGIAVMYVEWAGATYQRIVVPWAVIKTPDDALKFSDRLAEAFISRSDYTS